ncbi:MAG: hypothetical protein ACRDYU_11200, partial [Actinomycetes bacterium]
SGRGPVLAVAVAGGTLMLANGVLVGAVFAAVPRVAGNVRAVDVASGVVAQAGSLGSLLGPPLVAAAVGVAGWGTVPAAAAVCAGGAAWLLARGATVP